MYRILCLYRILYVPALILGHGSNAAGFGVWSDRPASDREKLNNVAGFLLLLKPWEGVSSKQFPFLI